VHEPNDFEPAFAAIIRDRPEGLVVLVDAFLNQHRNQIMHFIVRNHLPAVSQFREFVELGGLISYGPNLTDMYRRAGNYVDRILKGAKPADLPIEQPTKFELVLNLKTAKTLGLTIPQSILLRADEVIE
jgi:putative ABC transport system substrate-binding protein